MAWTRGNDDAATSEGGQRPGAATLIGGGVAALLIVMGLATKGISGGVIMLGMLVLVVGAWAVLRGRARRFGIASRRAAAGVAAAGFVVTGIGGSLAPASDAEPLPAQAAVSATSSAAPTTTSPVPTRPVQAAPTTTAAPTTPTPVLPPAPVMAMTCPSGASGASPVFAQDISATGPYSVTIDYGDGEVYTNDDQHLGAIFTHRYPSAGTFAVQAVLTDVAGQTTTAGCSYTWTAPRPAPAPAPAPAPVVGSTGGSGGGSVSGGGSTGGGATYANCSEVRAAGAAPIRVGDPGFQSKFDRDGDGVGCEN